eukprot:1162065-Pelagomonas_calceolata.AAC.1
MIVHNANVYASFTCLHVANFEIDTAPRLPRTIAVVQCHCIFQHLLSLAEKERTGMSYIAVRAYKGSLAEAKQVPVTKPTLNENVNWERKSQIVCQILKCWQKRPLEQYNWKQAFLIVE